MTTRRSLWAVLLAALGVKAYAKDKPCKPVYVPFQTPQSTRSGLPHWFYGAPAWPLQCPLCGEMHDGKEWTSAFTSGVQSVPGAKKLFDCKRCRNAFFQDAGV